MIRIYIEFQENFFTDPSDIGLPRYLKESGQKYLAQLLLTFQKMQILPAHFFLAGAIPFANVISFLVIEFVLRGGNH